MISYEYVETITFVRLLLVNIFASDCELFAKMRHGLRCHLLGQQPVGSHTIPLDTGLSFLFSSYVFLHPTALAFRSHTPNWIMTELPQTDLAIVSPAPRFPGNVEPLRTSRIALQHLAHHGGSHNYLYSWGHTIFRTVYGPGPDEAFAKAIERLAVYAKFFTQDEQSRPRPGQGAFDSRLNEELWSRYYCEVVQNEEALAGASEIEVGDMFDAWIKQHRRAATTSSACSRPNGRFLFCLMLDEQSIDDILELPEDPRAPVDYGSSWIKVVTNRVRSSEEGGGGRWWLRVGVADYLWPMWFYTFDPDSMLEEMGWKDAEDGVQNLWGSPAHRD